MLYGKLHKYDIKAISFYFNSYLFYSLFINVELIKKTN